MLDYHSDTTHLTKTQLATFLKSPVDYYHTFVTGKMPRKKSLAMMVGSVCHSVLLEDKKLSDVFSVYPASCLKSNGAINPKPAEQFRADNPGIEVGKERDEWQILSVLAAVRESELGKLIELAHYREHVMYGLYKGRAIKCKPDFYYPGLIYDLKFSEDISDVQVAQNFRRFKYWFQDAHYSACVGGNPGFRFWVVETKFPYRIKSRNYNEIAREIATDKWRRTMDRFIEAEETDTWIDETHAEYGLSQYETGVIEDDAELEGCDEYSEV